MWIKREIVIFWLSSMSAAFLVVDSAAVEDGNSLSFHDNHRRYNGIRGPTRRDPPAKKKKVRFTVRLHLPEVTDQILNDEGTQDLNELSRQLTRDIQALYSRTPGQQRVYNMKFRQFKKKKDRFNKKRQFSNRNQFDSSDSAVDFQEPKKPKTTLATLATSTQPIKAEQPYSLSFLSSSSRHRLDPLSSTSSIASPELDGNAHRDLIDVGTTVTTAKATLTTKKPVPWTSQDQARIEDFEKSTKSLEMKQSQETLDVDLTTRLFKQCYARSKTSGDYVILLEAYIKAYRELMKIFDLFGPIFTFAADDVKQKLTTLKKLWDQDMTKSEENYLTFQNMFAYEFSPEGAHANRKGVSTNKWIHRPLKFISGLVKGLRNKESDKTMGTWARELYADILAPHHDWYVRMGVYVALLSFPSRETLLMKLGVPDDDSGMQMLSDFSSVIDAVYDDVQKLYMEYS